MTHTQLHRYKRAASILCLSGLVIALNLFIVCLPQIGNGIWPQSESAIALLHAASALCTAGIVGLHSLTGLVTKAFRHPLILIPLALGILSLALLPFSALPVRSLLGSVRTGESVIWWFDLTVLSAAALLLWRIPLYRKILIAAALSGFILSFALSMSHVLFHNMIAPYFFADYIGFHIIALMPVACAALSKKLKPLPLFLTGYALLNILLLITENKAMIAYGFTVPLVFALIWSVPVISGSIKNKLETICVVFIPVVALAAFLSIAHITTSGGFYNFADTGLFRSFASRAFLIDTALNAVTSDPARFLTGYGWGSFVEHMARDLPLKWLNLMDHGVAQWDGLTSDHFHPHNMFLETLSATGIIGCALLFAYILSLYTNAKPALKKPAFLMSAGFMTWASFWFFLPVNLPFLAFAAASLAKSAYTKFTPGKAALNITLTVTIILQIAGAFITQSTAVSTQDYDPQALIVEKAQSFQENCPVEYNDYAAGGLHLSRGLLDRLRYTIRIENEIKEGKVDEDEHNPKKIRSHIESLNHLFCQATNYAQNHTPSARLQIARLMTRGEILIGLAPYLDEQTRLYYETGWSEDIENWLSIAPTRTDQAVPYLLYNIINNREQDSADIVNLIHKQNPQDPVGLWFTGLNLLSSPAPTDTQKGLVLMKQALKNGIQRFMPVEKDVLNLLENR